MTELPRAKPEDVGLSAERLGRLTATLQGDIDKGAVPGAVVLVARKGRIACCEALGYRDREAKAPMDVGTRFRIYSMTKPITSVCAMMLAEQGKLTLADPVAKYLPEFAGLKTAVDSDDATAKKLATEKARAMTVQDLLRHTSGLTYAHLTGPLLKQAYEDGKIGDDKLTSAELVSALAKVPLAYQPGTTFQYGLSTDVLGRVVEVAGGMPLDQFIDARVCRPLGMTDSNFGPADAEQVAEPQIDAATGKRPPLRNPTRKPAFISGGSGMLSTARDYARFCQMLLNGGALGETRLLAPSTVALMASEHLPPSVKYGPQMRAMFGALAPVPEHGIGFGLGFAVRKEQGRCALPGSIGDYSWSGVSGTYFWIDPQQEMFAILLMQAPVQRMHYRYLMRTMVYQAVTDSSAPA